MNIVIVGDGIAGRTAFGSILSKLAASSSVSSSSLPIPHVFVKSLFLIDSSPNKSSVNDPIVNHFHTGLWKPSRQHLKNLFGLNRYNELIYQHLQPIMESGYRDHRGNWLAKPSLPSPSDDPPLQFIQSKQLGYALQSFIQLILPTSQNKYNCQIVRDCFVKEISLTGLRLQSSSSINSSSSNIVDDNENEYLNLEADMIIAADGSYSRIRSMIQSKENLESSLKDLQFLVYRGISPRSNNDSTAFQTWSIGSRFASVPITNHHNQWFAAIDRKFLTNLGYLDSEVLSLIQSTMATSPRKTTSHELAILRKIFSSHHSPIPQLLQTTLDDSSVVVSAMASKSIRNPSNLSSNSIPVVFLGDAHHTSDPILAQGSGLAIEDGSNFIEVFFHHLHQYPSQLFHDKFQQRQVILKSIEQFEKKRYKRLKRLAEMSWLADSVGNSKKEWQVSLRDFTLRSIPSFIKTAAFDQFLQYTLQEE